VLVVEKTYLVYGQQIKIKPYRNVGFFLLQYILKSNFFKDDGIQLLPKSHSQMHLGSII